MVIDAVSHFTQKGKAAASNRALVALRALAEISPQIKEALLELAKDEAKRRKK